MRGPRGGRGPEGAASIGGEHPDQAALPVCRLEKQTGMKPVWAVLLAAAVFVLASGTKLAQIRNQLVTDRESIDAAWTEVESALGRRAELIPSLVESVKGHAVREKEAVTAVAGTRAKLAGGRTPQEKMHANAQLDAALARLLVTMENYPASRAGGSFPRVVDELASAEDRIAVERRKYNDAVQKYNTEIEIFPDNVVAALAGFSRNDAYFRAGPGARAMPAVK